MFSTSSLHDSFFHFFYSLGCLPFRNLLYCSVNKSFNCELIWARKLLFFPSPAPTLPKFSHFPCTCIIQFPSEVVRPLVHISPATLQGQNLGWLPIFLRKDREKQQIEAYKYLCNFIKFINLIVFLFYMKKQIVMRFSFIKR